MFHGRYCILNVDFTYQQQDGWMDGWLGFNGILSTQVAAISLTNNNDFCDLLCQILLLLCTVLRQ